VEGLILERIEEPKVEIVNGRLIYTQNANFDDKSEIDRLPTYERVGKIYERNLLEKDGSWGEVSYLASREKQKIRLY
jgi:hypothetical protein